MPGSSPEPRILYVAGNGRSGSTLINQILGEIEGWFGAGELWLSGRRSLCSCGAGVDECEFWGSIIGGFCEAPGEHLLAVARERRRRAAGRPPVLSHPEVIASLYRDVHEASGANLIVDVSNLLMPALLTSLTDCELYVVHLVRDPRAYAYAWTKQKLRVPDLGAPFPQWSPQRSSFRWLRRHAAIETLLRRRLRSRYLLFRYEDFAKEPLAAIRSICAMVGEPNAELPFLAENTVRLKPNHNISGNTTRFLEGPVDITEDDEWKPAMPRRQALVATLIGAPLMRRYGYPLTTRSQ
jgi:hypothetical protein